MSHKLACGQSDELGVGGWGLGIGGWGCGLELRCCSLDGPKIIHVWHTNLV